jgi:hypothetical protein
MNTIAEVLDFIVPKGIEYTLIGNPTNAGEYKDALNWHSEGTAPTWTEIQTGLTQLQQKVNQVAADKAALLAKLGITADEARLLLS